MLLVAWFWSQGWAVLSVTLSVTDYVLIQSASLLINLRYMEGVLNGDGCFHVVSTFLCDGFYNTGTTEQYFKYFWSLLSTLWVWHSACYVDKYSKLMVVFYIHHVRQTLYSRDKMGVTNPVGGVEGNDRNIALYVCYSI